MIRFRKFDPYRDSQSARLFGGSFSEMRPGGIYDPQPAYIAELTFSGPSPADPIPLARIEREKMSGSGNCNMWGSRYRWALHRWRREGDGSPRIHGTVVEYHDTLLDCKESIAVRVAYAFGKD